MQAAITVMRSWAPNEAGQERWRAMSALPGSYIQWRRRRNATNLNRFRQWSKVVSQLCAWVSVFCCHCSSFAFSFPAVVPAGMVICLWLSPLPACLPAWPVLTLVLFCMYSPLLIALMTHRLLSSIIHNWIAHVWRGVRDPSAKQNKINSITLEWEKRKSKENGKKWHWGRIPNVTTFYVVAVHSSCY